MAGGNKYNGQKSSKLEGKGVIILYRGVRKSRLRKGHLSRDLKGRTEKANTWEEKNLACKQQE